METVAELAQHERPADADDERWLAVLACDVSADGRFFYSVITTGIYCRPSCRSRSPKRENVQFHLTAVDAEICGFRPCKRCQPDGPTRQHKLAKSIIQVCRKLASADKQLNCDLLASLAGMSRFHFQRTFKVVTGLTPKAYALECRARRVRRLLRESATVTEAIYAAGYNSHTRFYEQAGKMLGMRPKDFLSGGAGIVCHYAVVRGRMGHVLVAATDAGVCAIEADDDAQRLVRELRSDFRNALLRAGDSAFVCRIAAAVQHADALTARLALPADIKLIVFRHHLTVRLKDGGEPEARSLNAVAQLESQDEHLLVMRGPAKGALGRRRGGSHIEQSGGRSCLSQSLSAGER